MRVREVFRFPDTVNETAARLVAAFVAAASLVELATGAHWILPPLATGFLLRVLAGPRLSPLAIVVTRVVIPRFGLPVRPVAGTPKRFAQAIGFTVTTAASALAFAGAPHAAAILVAILAACALLEAAAGLCLGCALFSLLIRFGLVPAPVCRNCAPSSVRARP